MLQKGQAVLQGWDGAGRNFQLWDIPSPAASILFTNTKLVAKLHLLWLETTSLGNREMETFVWMETTWERPRVFLACPFFFPCQEMGCWVIQVIPPTLPPEGFQG